MILWRISNYETLDGVGGLIVSGRWHTKGRPIVYCTQNSATALLETLVHMDVDSDDRPRRIHVLRIKGPNSLSCETIAIDSLSSQWAEDLIATQAMGDRWLAEGGSLPLQVPSLLVPETWNVLVNPQHSQANLLQTTAIYEHPFDSRLF